MRRHLNEFVVRDAVSDGKWKVKAHLLNLPKSDERRACHEAAVSLRQLGPLPYIAEEDLIT